MVLTVMAVLAVMAVSVVMATQINSTPLFRHPELCAQNGFNDTNLVIKLQ